MQGHPSPTTVGMKSANDPTGDQMERRQSSYHFAICHTAMSDRLCKTWSDRVAATADEEGEQNSIQLIKRKIDTSGTWFIRKEAVQAFTWSHLRSLCPLSAAAGVAMRSIVGMCAKGGELPL